MLERRAEHETHSKRVFSSRRRASFTTPNSHIPHMHQLVCLGDSVLRAVCWGTFSFIKNQSCPNPHFLLGPSGWISWVTLPIGKEADYVHTGLVSSQVHLMLKNKKTHPRPSLLHFVPFFLLLWFCWLNLSQSLSLSPKHRLSVSLLWPTVDLAHSDLEPSVQSWYFDFPPSVPSLLILWPLTSLWWLYSWFLWLFTSSPRP